MKCCAVDRVVDSRLRRNDGVFLSGIGVHWGNGTMNSRVRGNGGVGPRGNDGVGPRGNDGIGPRGNDGIGPRGNGGFHLSVDFAPVWR